MDAMVLSEEKTLTRFNAGQDRLAEDFGYGATVGAMAIAQENLEELSSYIKDQISKLSALDEADRTKAFLRVIRNLDADVIALSALTTALHSVATDNGLRNTCSKLGYAIAGECWAKGLLDNDAALAKRIDRAVRKRHGNMKYRKQAAKSIAAKAGYRQKFWSRTDVIHAGKWLLECVLAALPQVFTLEEDREDTKVLTITDGALGLAERAVEHAVRNNAVFLPCTEPPRPWTDWNVGGYWDARSRLSASVVRAHHKETIAAIRSAIRSGAMKQHLDALNALQGVAFKINTKVLDVVEWCYENGVEIEGLPSRKDVEMPAKAAAWETLDDAERRLWKYRASKVKEHNRALVSNRVLFAQDVATAHLLSEHAKFWTPMNCDWRGRVYSISHFNFQRDDRVRALFLFADGEPIGEEGLYWLKVHVANCGDFGKISKRPFEERVAWVDEHLEEISWAATAPRAHVSYWSKADKPFLFLAACMELTSALSSGASYVTSLPVSFDGSCSGLQHLCAMTRAAEGSLVNLTPSALPQDVYQTVADKVNDRLRLDAEAGNDLASLSLAYGIGRGVVKRNVMTYSYSSKKFGMAQQQAEDLMRPLAFDVLAGKLSEHPFGPDDGRVAAKYLAGLIYEGIVSVVHLPAQAMGFLQKAARALAHEGKPLTWTTPTGLPWANRYYEHNVKRVELWLSDVCIRLNIADGTHKGINKDKSANGVAPNLVHACDAAHLLLTVLAAFSEDVTQLATVHDSFGCLASRAGRFRQIILETFVRMYEEHDVLAEVHQQAKCDLTVHNVGRLPDVPDYGPLNIKEVLNAQFAFA